MKKIVLYIAQSLDGYIADEQGGVQWLNGDGSEPDAKGTYADFYEGVDSILLGYSTYNQIITELSPDVWPYEGKDCYVLSRQDRAGDERVTFCQESPEQLIQKLKSEEHPASCIWICGGAQIAQPLIAAGLVDELRIPIIPVLLGKGVRLFGELEEMQKLRLTAIHQYNGIAELCYVRCS